MYSPQTMIDSGIEEKYENQRRSKRSRAEFVRDMRDMAKVLADDIRERVAATLETINTRVGQLEAVLYYSAWMISLLIEPEESRKKKRLYENLLQKP